MSAKTRRLSALSSGSLASSRDSARILSSVINAPLRRSPSPAWANRAPSSLRSNPRVPDSAFTLGRRRLAAGFLAMMSSSCQYL